MKEKAVFLAVQTAVVLCIIFLTLRCMNLVESLDAAKYDASYWRKMAIQRNTDLEQCAASKILLQLEYEK